MYSKPFLYAMVLPMSSVKSTVISASSNCIADASCGVILTGDIILPAASKYMSAFVYGDGLSSITLLDKYTILFALPTSSTPARVVLAGFELVLFTWF